ncbi:tetratricopeptide repeat protein [Acinetobacter gerneri]|uniref:tetratricopeptide repeat protein n=1 Tax=Acinetobacter gerneri TaxID=202952 RepID=UPI0023F3625E|nr:tetratricopeptide repeat protein [Acinetobacter gerneri]MCH4243048.1 hypothetical protein [Acinetobacter gerneri]
MKIFYLMFIIVLYTNIAWAESSSSKINFYSIGNSYLLYSPKLKNTRDYIWFKLAGDDNFGTAVSAGCDLLYEGIRVGNKINGKILYYETDISGSSEIKNIKASIDDSYITINDDVVFSQCGLNIVYGSFERIKISQKKYDTRISEVLNDGFVDAKENKKPNAEAFDNLIGHLGCGDVLKNIKVVNDIGFYLQQKKYSLNSERILNKVLECEPNRTVAYLNLGDSLYDQGKYIDARNAYEKYKKMMIKKGLSNQIPKRINN